MGSANPTPRSCAPTRCSTSSFSVAHHQRQSMFTLKAGPSGAGLRSPRWSIPRRGGRCPRYARRDRVCAGSAARRRFGVVLPRVAQRAIADREPRIMAASLALLVSVTRGVRRALPRGVWVMLDGVAKPHPFNVNLVAQPVVGATARASSAAGLGLATSAGTGVEQCRDSSGGAKGLASGGTGQCWQRKMI